MCVSLVSLSWFKVSEAHCVCGTVCKVMAQDTQNTLHSVAGTVCLCNLLTQCCFLCLRLSGTTIWWFGVSEAQVVFGQPVSFVRVLCCGVSALVSQFGSLICNVCDTICWLMAQDT